MLFLINICLPPPPLHYFLHMNDIAINNELDNITEKYLVEMWNHVAYTCECVKTHFNTYRAVAKHMAILCQIVWRVTFMLLT